VGTCRIDVKEEIQVRRPHKNESTNAIHRDGITCSSEEATVMEVERRSHVNSVRKRKQPKIREDFRNANKTI
jgi:hypothetical protein